MKQQLAVIIPAFKKRFLQKTLDSFAKQSNKNFNIYIGDDNSPEDLYAICNQYYNRLNINYHKFETNIGAKNLVLQWNRCLGLSKDENWIWLFSDDDTVDFNCVDLFFKTILEDNSAHDVYRFNTRVIDDFDNLILETPESPYIDTSENMAYEILMGRRGNSMPDHIYNKNKVIGSGGFFITKYASAADWGSSIFFSFEKGIKTMQGAKVNWRLGEYNITGTVKKSRKEKIEGHVFFLISLYLFFQDKFKYKTKHDFCQAINYNLLSVIRYHYKGFNFSNIWDFYKLFKVLKKNTILAIFSLLLLLYKIVLKSSLQKFKLHFVNYFYRNFKRLLRKNYLSKIIFLP